jgi:DNA-binding MarR family transcriptional regulator
VADRLVLEKSTVSRMVADLERNGLVERDALLVGLPALIRVVRAY